jgi:hypothetical protein
MRVAVLAALLTLAVPASAARQELPTLTPAQGGSVTATQVEIRRQVLSVS